MGCRGLQDALTLSLSQCRDNVLPYPPHLAFSAVRTA